MKNTFGGGFSLYDFAHFGMGGGGSSTQTTVQELSPEQRKLIEPVIPIAQGMISQPPQMYPGSGISGFNPLQQMAQQMTIGAAQGMLPGTSVIPQRLQGLQNAWGQTANTAGAMGAQGQGQLNAALGAQAASAMSPGLNFLTSGQVLTPDSNPALQAAIQGAVRPTIENFQNVIMPGIASEAVSAGGYGGSRQGIAQGLASNALTRNVGDVASQMMNQNYQAGLGAMTSGLNTQQNALGQLITGQLGGQQAQQGWMQQQQNALQGAGNLLGQTENILSQGLLPAKLTEAVGTQQQAMEQARLTEQVQRYVNEQMLPFAVAQDVAAMAFGMPGGTTRTTTTGQQGGQGAGMLQSGLGAVAALPALFGKSDRKLKENIKFIETLYDGLKVYMYNLIGEKMIKIGLMADEVMELYPLAVRDAGEYLTVRYDLVPTWHMRARRG